MKIFRHAGTSIQPGDPQTFTGPVHAKLLGSGGASASVHVYRVEFDSGGRTNWHRHTGAQWLLIVEGRIRVQLEGSAAEDVQAGDAIMIEPGEKHWHGSAPGSRGVHLAVNVNAKTEWLEPVSDEAYGGASGSRPGR